MDIKLAYCFFSVYRVRYQKKTYQSVNVGCCIDGCDRSECWAAADVGGVCCCDDGGGDGEALSLSEL